MSWDIFLQEIPPGILSVEDIPDEFEPRTLGTRQEIIARITELVPFANFDDPTWGTIDSPAARLEINLGDEDPVQCIALHVRGGTAPAGFVFDLLSHLKVGALDSATGELFDTAAASESFEEWQNYKRRVVGERRAT